MSDELKPCPNRICRNDRVVTASRMLDASGLSQAFGECPKCGTRGPMVAGVTMVDAVTKARDAWDDLPRDEGPGEATRALLTGMTEHLEDHDGEVNTIELWVVVDELEAALRECGIEVES